MFELKRATVEILNYGSYDGMKHLTFPIRIENRIDYGIEVGMVDVPLDELIAAGYDRDAGKAPKVKDSSPFDDALTWILGGEAEVLEILA